ncbi:formate dehydrogenase accessory sulfurtransferase FdhD [Methylococcus sp. EFPC2]|uniref:formate dehydrogenase accessory sulfurtransferase FdhD n=1 Tax=Methylococcus sp. EFPC2 TaxID=2812648 RepID=UPI001967DF0E|nr:formate dehydrogenase accessory sulfurtransferase FdhD [Methylococcus sp. EFPC2]QSA97170.1 formate dehydrogenase accessory sulfurtransferase FdhD [Methylococcus sp. EFPC2]
MSAAAEKTDPAFSETALAEHLRELEPQGWSWPSYRSVEVERWNENGVGAKQDWVAEEVPVVLVYNGQPHVVMLATPLDLEDFALGFSLTEGIVGSLTEIEAIRVHHRSEGIEVRIRLVTQNQDALAGRERNLTGRTGCGLCGTTSLRQAIRRPAPVKSDIRVSPTDLHGALQNLRAKQEINRLTGAVHAAAWVLPGRGIAGVREDVGRHNALDKLIGMLSRTPREEGYVLVTSRASYEMVQKCASAGIGLMAAVSAPTGLAIRLAKETGLTLVGFARDDSHVVYAHPWRLT